MAFYFYLSTKIIMVFITKSYQDLFGVRSYINANKKATWCKIRSCCQENKFNTCAECSHDVRECKLFSNWISKVFAFLFNSDRSACISYIKEQGEQAFAEEMTKRKCQTIRRK